MCQCIFFIHKTPFVLVVIDTCNRPGEVRRKHTSEAIDRDHFFFLLHGSSGSSSVHRCGMQSAHHAHRALRCRRAVAYISTLIDPWPASACMHACPHPSRVALALRRSRRCARAAAPPRQYSLDRGLLLWLQAKIS